MAARIDERTRRLLAEQGLQATFAPHNACFGCGPANEKGLQIQSIPREEEVFCEWRAQPHHEAFPGMLNGGIIGALLDCHSNWTACWHLMNEQSLERPPCTVTAEYSVKMRRPAPSGETIHLRAWVTDSSEDRATVEAELIAAGEVCARCRGVFVAVKEGHPAYHRW